MIRNSTPFCTPRETPLNGPADPAGCSGPPGGSLRRFFSPHGHGCGQNRARSGPAPGLQLKECSKKIVVHIVSSLVPTEACFFLYVILYMISQLNPSLQGPPCHIQVQSGMAVTQRLARRLHVEHPPAVKSRGVRLKENGRHRSLRRAQLIRSYIKNEKKRLGRRGKSPPVQSVCAPPHSPAGRT